MFGPSLSLGKLFGIPLRIHWTFSLLLVWAALGSFAAGGTLKAALAGAVFLLAVFACVVLHELGHSLTARAFGIRTRHITLSPIGGVAALDSMPKRWSHELWITLMGPAVNIAICLLILPLLFLFPPAMEDFLAPFGFASLSGFLAKLFLVNIFLSIFNLVPAFPMDGGRVFRALLSARGDRVWATRVAARTGQVFAVGFGLLAFLGSPLLLVIAGFIFLAAEAELRAVIFDGRIRGVRVSDVMQTRFETLDESETLAGAAERFLRSGRGAFPVMRGDRMVGLLERPALQQSIRKGEAGRVAGEIALRDFALAAPSDELSETFQLMQKTGQNSVPVFDGERLVGLVFPGSLEDWRQLSAATGRSARAEIQQVA